MLPRTCLLTMLRNDTCWLFCFLILSSIFAPFHSILSTLLSNYKTAHRPAVASPSALHRSAGGVGEPRRKIEEENEDMSLKSTVRFFSLVYLRQRGHTKPRAPDSSVPPTPKPILPVWTLGSLVAVSVSTPTTSLFDGRSNCFSQRAHLLLIFFFALLNLAAHPLSRTPQKR